MNNIEDLRNATPYPIDVQKEIDNDFKKLFPNFVIKQNAGKKKRITRKKKNNKKKQTRRKI